MTKNCNFVCKHKHMGDAGQNVVHESLEVLASVLQPERHPQELPQAKGGDDGRLLHVLGLHWDLPVPLPEVMVVKTFIPSSLVDRSSMCGGGYRSGLVTRLSCL